MDVTFTNVLEGARQYFQGLPSASAAVGPYYQHQQNAPQHQGNSQGGSGSTVAQELWQQNPNEPNRPPTRERTPTQRPSSHSSTGSRPPSHSSQYQEAPRQYHSAYQQHQPQDSQPTSQSQMSFQFSRPQSCEASSNHQYQPHIVTSSPYHQPASPQLTRVQSREQIAPAVQSYQHPQSAGYQNPQSQYGYQPRSYYAPPVQSEPKTTSSYLPTQSYQSSSQTMYYKHNSYSSQSPSSQAQQNSYRLDNQGLDSSNPHQNNGHYQSQANNGQAYRTTHNLPPIAALSNYHSSRSVKEPAKTSIPRSRIPSTSSYTATVSETTNNPSIIQHTPRTEVYSNATSIYNQYQSLPNQNHQRIVSHASTATIQSYSNVIMTTTNTSYYSSPPNQNQASGQAVYQTLKTGPQTLPRGQTSQNASYSQHTGVDNRTNSTSDPVTTSVIKQKRESPLDLSVKTVRTPADSTLEESEGSSQYLQNKALTSSSISTHNYPTLDINSIQRNLTHRSQLPIATAPKMEFHPNFNLPTGHSGWMPVKQTEAPVRKSIFQENVRNNVRPEYRHPVYQTGSLKGRYPTGHIPTVPQPSPVPTKNISVGSESSQKTNQMYPYQSQELTKKRPGEIPAPAIPNKVAKVESWRHSIDLQIEQKLSNYKQQQQMQQQQYQHKMSTATSKPPLVNGNYPSIDRAKEMYHYQKQNYETAPQAQSYSKSQNYYSQTSHNQTYVPSPANHQYPGYFNLPVKHSQNTYLNPVARSNSNPSLPTMGKQNMVGGVDKRVLSLLRNSIEVKEQKKLEQQKSHENIPIHPRSDVQHPNTDVTAPLQPKPGVIGRNNVSPFTPTSFPDPNMASMYKFQMPKAMESVNFESEIKQMALVSNKELEVNNTIITNNANSSSDYDGLAAFLAARIRTKGELKQVGHSHNSNNNTSRDSRIQAFIEDQIKSPLKQNTQLVQNSSTSTGTTSSSTTSPKLLKERQTAFAPRKRLFSRTEEDLSKTGVPLRDKSGLRSSSETSVFDFPDSEDDSEMPVLERQSLEAMRRDRRSSIRQTTTPVHSLEAEVKVETPRPPSRPISPEDDLFSAICDNLMKELLHGPRKRIRRTKCVDLEDIVKLETAVTDTTEVQIKIEIDEGGTLVNEYKEQGKSDLDNKPVNPFDVPVKEKDVEECKTPLILGNVIKSDSDLSDSEVKKDGRIAIRNKHRVRRKIISSSDSSDNEDEVKPKEIVQEPVSAPDKKAECDKPSEIKPETPKPEVKEENMKEKPDTQKTESESPKKSADVISVIRPAKKPSFGTGSDFYPGWEEGVYKYKKSLRMPPSLIQVTRPPASMRLSTSLPDLDPCPQSPTPSVTTDSENKESSKKAIKKFKSEPIDSDSESTSSFNIFSKKTNYDSEGSSSIRSLPNTRKENSSILDRLLEKCGGRKKRKNKRKDDHSPKVVPKAENPVELLPTPTPSLDSTEKGKRDKKLKTPVIKAKSAVLPFRKDTVNNFKTAFINSGSSLLGVHDKFTTIVLSSRTRKETRALKQRATIKEVFGEDRPASAPPVTCVNDMEIKEEVHDPEPFSINLEEIMIKKEKVDKIDSSKDEEITESNLKQIMKTKVLNSNENSDSQSLFKNLANKKIKEEVIDDDDEDKKLIDLIIKKDPDARSETTSLDGDEGSISGKRRNKFGKMRRKFSSGFDYIRKKKKIIKKENVENESVEKKKRVTAKTPESIDDIQKEIKMWVLNKGIGESHLHRAARLGYTDITAYCLEKMECHPSPKDNAGYTPLHEACSRGHLHIAKLLLKYGANVHESAQGGIRPLHEAIENGFVEIVRLLLSYGADPSLATYAGITPLSLASDETTNNLLKSHVTDRQGESGPPWSFYGPSSCFDLEESGYDVLDEIPKTDTEQEFDDIEIEMSETLLPNLYSLRGEPPTERWVLLQDLSNLLKIKSRDALLRQISTPSTSTTQVNYKSVLRELKMSDFLEQAHCCQFLNMGEKINTRASKIALVKYTDKVRELLGIESVVVTAR